MTLYWTTCLAGVALAGACNTALITTGLTGTMMRGPVTPVCQVSVPCDEPLTADFDVLRNGRKVSSFRSDAEGRFIVRLEPGVYTIVPGPDTPIMNAAAQAKSVTVNAEGLTEVQLLFDTGIR